MSGFTSPCRITTVEEGTSHEFGQETMVHGFIINTPAGAPVDTTVTFWSGGVGVGTAVLACSLDTSLEGLSKAVMFPVPAKVSNAGVAVTGTDGTVHVLHD